MTRKKQDFYTYEEQKLIGGRKLTGRSAKLPVENFFWKIFVDQSFVVREKLVQIRFLGKLRVQVVLLELLHPEQILSVLLIG